MFASAKTSRRNIKTTRHERTRTAVEGIYKLPTDPHLPTAQIRVQPTTLNSSAPGNSRSSTPTLPQGKEYHRAINSRPVNPSQGTPNNHVRFNSASNPGSLGNARPLVPNNRPVSNAAPTKPKFHQ